MENLSILSTDLWLLQSRLAASAPRVSRGCISPICLSLEAPHAEKNAVIGGAWMGKKMSGATWVGVGKSPRCNISAE